MIQNEDENHFESVEEMESLHSYTEAEKLEHLKKWEYSNLELLLKQWGEKAACNRWMHMYSSEAWKKTDKNLNMISICLSSVVSGSSLVGVFESFFPKNFIMLFVGLIGLLNIISQSTIRYYNPSQKAALHDLAAQQFGNFQRFIVTKLSLSRLERGPPKLILEYVLKENDRLYKENMEPLNESMNAFILHFKSKIEEKEFEIPDYVNNTLSITIFDKNPAYQELKKLPLCKEKPISSIDIGDRLSNSILTIPL